MNRQEYRRLVCAAAAALLCGCASQPAPSGPLGVPEGPRPASPEPAPPQPAARVLRIGVITSVGSEGVLNQFSQLILDGARVAAEEASRGGRRVELVLRDDGGSAAGSARVLRELEGAGIGAVVGPLIEDGVAAAAAARTDPDLALVSPTATTDPSGRRVWALNTTDTRGAAALGEWARRYQRVGVLHSRAADAQRNARAFMAAYGNAGTVRAAVFAEGVTNVSAQLRQLREARVQALYVPGNARELQAVLPQVEYLGIEGLQLMGDETWLADNGRGLPQRVIEDAVIALPLFRDSDAIAWAEFVERFEATHRRVIESAFPALGYDAVMLAVRAAEGGSMDVDDYRGATGLMSLRGDSVTRRPFLVRRDAGRLIPVN